MPVKKRIILREICARTKPYSWWIQSVNCGQKTKGFNKSTVLWLSDENRRNNPL